MVVGASTGIGLATVRRFIAEGAYVYGVGEDCSAFAELKEQFTFLKCDVTLESDIERVCAEVADKHHTLDSLVTVASKLFRGGVTQVDAALIEEANKHICVMPMLFTKYCTPMLKKSANPSITHDVPMSAYMTELDYLNSSFSTAVINYSRQACSQIRPIRVNTILFGIMTDHLLTPEEVAVYDTPEHLAKIPAGRLGKGSDVAGVNAFLASDKARYLNSWACAVDGGYYTMNPRSMGNNGI